MKAIYINWPREFLEGLEFIRAMDNRYLAHPIYAARAPVVFGNLSREIVHDFEVAFGRSADERLSTLTMDQAYHYYTCGGAGDPVLDRIILISRNVCEAVKISEVVYSSESLFFCLWVLQGKDDDARRYFHKILRPAVMLRRIKDVMQVIGTEGGRSKHRLYGEAMIIAINYMSRNPSASHRVVAIYVRSELKVKHSHVPAERTIREWLKSF